MEAANATTLIEVMLINKDKPVDIHFIDLPNEHRAVSYYELYRRSLNLLSGLRQCGMARGDKLILFLTDNESFLYAFWAAILGGIVPVPVAAGTSDQHGLKLSRIAAVLKDAFLYTERRQLDIINEIANGAHTSGDDSRQFRKVLFAGELPIPDDTAEPIEAGPGDVAFIQFSSGSTSDPKGVVLTHSNLMANCRGVIEAAAIRSKDSILSWMPLTHDMGLIGCHIVFFTSACPMHIIRTDLFVRRPLLWLSLASQLQVSILCSPNFGFQHYLNALGDRSVKELDLSGVRIIFNGAEPISLALSINFSDRLAEARLGRNVIFPVYGLAEASLAVCFPRLGAPINSIALNRHAIRVGSRVDAVSKNEVGAISFVSEGRAVPFCAVRISSADGKPFRNEHIGHVQVRGENVTCGYYMNAQANKVAYTSDGWLRTGDIGFIYKDDLYICGRAKESICVNGQNYFPHDLEDLVRRSEQLDVDRVVVTSVQYDQSDSELLVVFILFRGSSKDFYPLSKRIVSALGKHAGLLVSAVVPVRHIPKTTSGKIRRFALRDDFTMGRFDAALSEIAIMRSAEHAQKDASLNKIAADLKSICQRALPHSNAIGVDHNLFEVGMNSLTLVQIFGIIDEKYPGSIELADLYKFPTIGEMATRIESRRLSGSEFSISHDD
jgi:acyl-CoA synthetase (AMP-forming)/AMP-acid ligase II/acyl carrier protein